MVAESQTLLQKIQGTSVGEVKSFVVESGAVFAVSLLLISMVVHEWHMRSLFAVSQFVRRFPLHTLSDHPADPVGPDQSWCWHRW
jgi:hypothetical protein